jgi:hypothetical protein
VMLLLLLFVLVGHFLLCSLWFCRCYLTSLVLLLGLHQQTLHLQGMFFNFFLCVFVLLLYAWSLGVVQCFVCLFVVICFCRMTLQILIL